MLDFILATAHHLAAFGVIGTLFAEMALVRPGLDAAAIRRAARLDAVYGLCALTVLLAGFGRALFAAKGWDYYSHNLAFWAKLAVFALIGLLSIRPTLTLRRWLRQPSLATETAVRAVRWRIHAQLMLFPLLPALAAAMARGIWQL